MQFLDRGKISSRKITDEGYLKVGARAGRPGIQKYSPLDFRDSDLPKSLKGKSEIRLLRPEQEVFLQDSVESFRLKPVTIEHPPVFLNAQNVKQYQVGIVDAIGQKESDLEAQILVQDSDAIRTVEAGKEQVSLGYDADIEWTSGDNETHGVYDGVMRNIRGNHLAIVDRARAGSAYRLFDHAAKEKNMSDNVKVNDALTAENSKLKVAVSDAGAEIESLKAKVSDSQTRIAELAAELETTKKSVITDSDLQAKVEAGVKERLDVADSAKSVMPELEVAGKSKVEIQLEVIDHLTGGESQLDKDDVKLVDGVYETVVKIAKAQPKNKVNDALSKANQTKISDSDAARQRMIERRRGGK